MISDPLGKVRHPAVGRFRCSGDIMPDGWNTVNASGWKLCTGFKRLNTAEKWVSVDWTLILFSLCLTNTNYLKLFSLGITNIWIYIHMNYFSYEIIFICISINALPFRVIHRISTSRTRTEHPVHNLSTLGISPFIKEHMNYFSYEFFFIYIFFSLGGGAEIRGRKNTPPYRNFFQFSTSLRWTTLVFSSIFPMKSSFPASSFGVGVTFLNLGCTFRTLFLHESPLSLKLLLSLLYFKGVIGTHWTGFRETHRPGYESAWRAKPSFDGNERRRMTSWDNPFGHTIG